MPDKRLAWLVFAWLTLASTLGLAQERQQVSLGSDALPVTVFADRAFPTVPLYSGNPWFVPALMRWYGWRDRWASR